MDHVMITQAKAISCNGQDRTNTMMFNNILHLSDRVWCQYTPLFEHTCAYARWALIRHFASVCHWNKIHWTKISTRK